MSIADELEEAAKPRPIVEVSLDQQNWFEIDVGRKTALKALVKSATFHSCGFIDAHFMAQESGRSSFHPTNTFGKAMKGMKLGEHGPKSDESVRIYWRVVDPDGNEMAAGWRERQKSERSCHGKNAKRTK